MGEINKLKWCHVNLSEGYLTLHTRKKKSGAKKPRKIKMSENVLAALKNRYKNKHPKLPYVFWHKYWSRKEKKHVTGRYKDRKRLMRSLCRKAEVEYFRYHAFRHAAASLLAKNPKIALVDIKTVLGHERITTTAIYIEDLTKDTTDTVNTLEDMTMEMSGNNQISKAA
jgi:integrase